MNLYPYQVEGAQYLAARKRAYLADDMGLGKTLQALTAADSLKVSGAVRALIGCPASVIENWRRERGRVELYLGDQFEVASYAKAPPAGEWDVVILDEAHYLKNPRAQRTKRWLKVASEATYAWALSGTPMPNHPGELFTVARAFGQTGIKTYGAWLDAFTKWTMTKWGKRPYAVQNVEQLRALLSPWMLRRTLADVALDLPPLRVDTHLLPKDGKVAEAFEVLGLKGMTAEEMLEAMRVAERRDIMARLRHFLGLYKAPRIGDILAAELDDKAYDKVVVFAYHRDVLKMLHDKLTPFGVVYIDGSIQSSARQLAIDKFTRDKRVRVFLGQQGASGTGTNLQAAHEAVLVEPSWTPEENRQYVKRIHRIGQSMPCRGRIFAVQGTLDDGLMATLASKAVMVEQTLGEGACTR